MFNYTNDGELFYHSKNDIKYSLLEGKTSNDKTSDIIFIFREPNQNELNNGYVGEVISFIYGGFGAKNFIEDTIKKYESNNL